MRFPAFLLSAGLCITGLHAQMPRVPLQPKLADSADQRWQNKKVIEKRVLDDMETLDHWTMFSTSHPGVVDARKPANAVHSFEGVANMVLTDARAHDGKHSVRLTTPTRLPEPGPTSGRGWGDSGVIRHFDSEDWTHFNRLSFWIYPECPGHRTISLDIELNNDGAVKVPGAFAQEGMHTIQLRNQEWNHILWEIGNVARDRITALKIGYGIRGNEPDSSDKVAFDFDTLELQRVDEDYIEGWGVWPGRISFSHGGYPAGAPKTAVASDLKARTFDVRDAKTGAVVLTRPVKTVTSHVGTFQVMDFSSVRRPGSYILVAGTQKTPPFAIGKDAWRDSILKALNFFYTERCGADIPGVHGVCHRDWQIIHGDKRIIMNGGWHDAGDLTQGMGNTGEAAYAMFALAERVRERGDDPELYNRLIEEARWGLDWILKTSFHDGYRVGGSINGRQTDGILGTEDDVIGQAGNGAMDFFIGAATEALAARVLKDSDPRTAAYALRMAREDWEFGIASMEKAKASGVLWTGTFDSGVVAYENTSLAIVSALDLWRATGDSRYTDKAVELAHVILDSQQRERPDWKVPFTGFFYTSPDHSRILHYVHRGREQAPLMALTRLAEALPNHPEWMKWYSAVVLHAEYLKAASKYTAPYDVLPASIYKDDEYTTVPETRRESFRKQVLNGVPLGDGHYLRLFPVWMDYRGHFGAILPQAQTLTEAARLRGDLASAQLARHQAEWILGLNPFAQSTMFGAGYDYATLYTPSSGDLVGALPVGIQSRGDADVPYWPIQNTWTYKEVWVHPVSRWIWLMRDVSGPSVVEGQATLPVEFVDTVSQQRTVVTPSAGRFHALLPEGRYTVRSGASVETLTCLPGSTHKVDLRPGKALDFELKATTAQNGEVVVKLTAHGAGSHRFTLRADNLEVADAERTVTLPAQSTIEWRARISDPKQAWVAVAAADGDIAVRKEVTGSAWER